MLTVVLACVGCGLAVLVALAVVAERRRRRRRRQEREQEAKALEEEVAQVGCGAGNVWTLCPSVPPDVSTTHQ